jgi:hypothetical protein
MAVLIEQQDGRLSQAVATGGLYRLSELVLIRTMVHRRPHRFRRPRRYWLLLKQRLQLMGVEGADFFAQLIDQFEHGERLAAPSASGGRGWRPRLIFIDTGRYIWLTCEPLRRGPGCAPRQIVTREAKVLYIELLGQIRISWGEHRSAITLKRQSLILLAHFALARTHREAREALIEKFWPETDPKKGHNNLSSALSRLRRALRPANPGIITLDGYGQAGIAAGAAVWFDADIQLGSRRRSRTGIKSWSPC